MKWRLFHLFPYLCAERLNQDLKIGNHVGISILYEIIKVKRKEQPWAGTCLSGVSECSDFKLDFSFCLRYSLLPETRLTEVWLQTFQIVSSFVAPGYSTSLVLLQHTVISFRGRSKSVTGQKGFWVKRNFMARREQASRCEGAEPVGMSQ